MPAGTRSIPAGPFPPFPPGAIGGWDGLGREQHSQEKRLSGWGRSTWSAARVLRPRSPAELSRLLRTSSGTGVIARGMGRSYGDAALCSRGTLLDLTARNRILDFDRIGGLLIAEAGITLAQITAATLAFGWLSPVLPGTAQVSLGGAIAADVHGKNHVFAGSFGAHVAWMLLWRGDGESVLLSPQHHPEQFWATVGGMGLTGVIATAAVQLRRVPSASVLTVRRPAHDLDEVLALLAAAAAIQADGTDLHAVAWIDTSAPDQALGRGIVETFRAVVQDEAHGCGARQGPTASRAVTDWALPWHGLVNLHSIRAANRLRWLTGRRVRQRTAGLKSALYPLDSADLWPAAFGRRGLIQYQFVVPVGAEQVLSRALSILRLYRMPPALAVLKRLGEASPAPMSFALPGWTLAMDFPARWAHLDVVLNRLDALVGEAGGRVYLAKDARLGAGALARMYPRLAQWRAIRNEMDPDQIFRSDLGERLGLVPRAGIR